MNMLGVIQVIYQISVSQFFEELEDFEWQVRVVSEEIAGKNSMCLLSSC